jgi:hypothetical protein
MAALSSKIRTVQGGYAHWCPGCKEMHILPIRQNGWTYQNMESAEPTATPSFLHTLDRHGRTCHYILTGGVLNFCSDCTHDLAGKPVQLPDIPEHDRLGLPGYA